MKKVFFAIIVSLFLLPVCVNAETVTIAITGEITDGYGSIWGDEIKAGTTFSGSYTYDTSTLNTSQFGNEGLYVHSSPFGMNISLGGYDFMTNSSHIEQFEIEITNSNSNGDFYKILSKENNTTHGISVENISWILGGQGTTISSSALTEFPPVITDWEYNSFEITAYDSFGSISVTGKITEAVVVPEPLTGALILSGIFFLKRKQ